MNSGFEAELHVVQLDLPPHPAVLARRVWGDDSVLLQSSDGSGPSFIARSPLARSTQLDPEPSLTWGPPTSAHSHVPRWIGVLSYEAQRSRLERARWSTLETRPAPLVSECLWYRFGAVAVVTDRVTVVGDDPRAVADLCQRLSMPSRDPILHATKPARIARVDADDASRRRQADRHRANVERALELIRDGDVYEINLARRLDFAVEGDTLALLEVMSESVAAPYAAALELGGGVGVVSTSPELLLQTDCHRRVLTAPIKGTRPRTGNAPVDEAAARDLEHDPKERAELAMVVDVERNDVGRIAEFGSVIAETPRVLPYSTVLHRVARVRGTARANVTRRELFEALLPSGSVTGAPKVRAMELIAELEEQRRGLYTGGLGYIGHDGCVHLGMAIRCLVRHDAVAHYHVGGGIVLRSDPERELAETFWKAEQVLRNSTP